LLTDIGRTGAIRGSYVPHRIICTAFPYSSILQSPNDASFPKIQQVVDVIFISATDSACCWRLPFLRKLNELIVSSSGSAL
jgi:hypothetical protein